jgi:hypothetical protein
MEYHFLTCDGPNCNKRERYSGGAVEPSTPTVRRISLLHRRNYHFCSDECLKEFVSESREVQHDRIRQRDASIYHSN